MLLLSHFEVTLGLAHQEPDPLVCQAVVSCDLPTTAARSQRARESASRRRSGGDEQASRSLHEADGHSGDGAEQSPAAAAASEKAHLALILLGQSLRWCKGRR